MLYAVQTLWFERRRYMAAMLAVAFSAVLIAVQGGVLVGLVATVSAPVDLSEAQVWVGAPHTPSCDNGSPIPTRWRNRLMMLPEVARTDEYIQKFDYWFHPKVGTMLVIVCGMNLSDETLGPVAKLTPEQRIALTEPNTVIIDVQDMAKMGVEKIGDIASIRGQRVRVVGFMDDMSSMTGCYAFCSLPTARRLLWYNEDETSFLLAKLNSPEDVPELLSKFEKIPELDVFTKGEFSAMSQWYWILKTKAGLAVFFTAVLGLLVGAVVTSQTLYSATAGLIRELAVLRSLGVPRWRMSLFVVQQSAVIGLIGLVLGMPLAYALQWFGNVIGTRIDIAAWLMVGTASIVLVMALVSGLFALRSLGATDPAELMR